MTASRLIKPWHLLLLSLVIFSLGLGTTFGQDEAPKEGEKEAPVVEKTEAPDEAKPTSDESFPTPVDITDEEPWDSFQYFNKPFEWMVGKMDATLFYRVWTGKQQYVEVNHVVYYVRNRGTDGPFEIAENSKARKPDDLPSEVNEAQIAKWIARGEVQGSADPNRDYRYGIWVHSGTDGKEKKQPVDYVKYVIKAGSKYVLVKEDDKETFRPVTKLRDTLNDDSKTWLSPKQVRSMAMEGELAINAKANGSETPYLFTEPVGGAPVVVLWLSGGAIFFTVYFFFINFWGFTHAVSIVRGTYDNPDEPGEVTHFQALASALSATVGLGNIAGVTIAMTLGGPGAFFWMLLCGFFGMTSKFVECTLGQMYREVKPDGTILGGPMQYLTNAFSQFGLKPIGQVVSVIFAIMCILASFGGGNMFQANQATSQVLLQFQQNDLGSLKNVNDALQQAMENGEAETIKSLQAEQTELKRRIESFEGVFKASFGLVMAILVGMVIIGGIKRIGAAASKIVPAMCLMYIAACLYIILAHITSLPSLIGQIFFQAFDPQAITGGILGVIVIGVQRAAFSNEAGVGSAAIAHSAAKTDEPVREGFVAMLGPFIDTIVVCSMTALVILITGAWENKEWIVNQDLKGVQLTSKAFEAELSFFPAILTVAVVLFAFSTIISWSYYGERCWERLFGARSIYGYKALFVFGVFVGSIFNLGAVLDFSDFMILSMAFPNILGAVLLAPKVKSALHEYWRKYKAGEFKKFK